MISKKSSQESETISFLCLFLCSDHAIGSQEDEGDREYLSHIDGERCFEGFLYLLGVFDEESEGEDIRQAKAKVPSIAECLRQPSVYGPHDG